MPIRFDDLRQLHHFLMRHALYPMLLSTGLACGLFAGRVYLSHGGTYRFLVWNLFLAWIPYVSALGVAWLHQTRPRQWWLLVLPSAIWLLFFPNAPYIITDFLHLQTRWAVPTWYDTILIAAFSWSGLFLGIFSLRAMQSLVRAFLGRILSWLFVSGTLLLSSLGIYIGRFLRWNSWDLLLHPRSVWTDVTVRLANPLVYRQTFGVTLLFAAFLGVCYLTFAAAAPDEQAAVVNTAPAGGGPAQPDPLPGQ
jgi:uncharacterized membrane protein